MATHFILIVLFATAFIFFLALYLVEKKKSKNISIYSTKTEPKEAPVDLIPTSKLNKEIKIRPLMQKDREFLTDLLKKIMKNTGDNSIAKMISSNRSAAADQSKSEEEEMGRFISGLVTDTITLGLDLFDDEIKPWFQDLLEVEPKEYQLLPMNIEIRVLEYIRTAPEAGGFFIQCLRRAKMTQWLDKLSKPVKKALEPILDSVKETLSGLNTQK